MAPRVRSRPSADGRAHPQRGLRASRRPRMKTRGHRLHGHTPPPRTLAGSRTNGYGPSIRAIPRPHEAPGVLFTPAACGLIQSAAPESVPWNPAPHASAPIAFRPIVDRNGRRFQAREPAPGSAPPARFLAISSDGPGGRFRFHPSSCGTRPRTRRTGMPPLLVRSASSSGMPTWRSSPWSGESRASVQPGQRSRRVRPSAA